LHLQFTNPKTRIKTHLKHFAAAALLMATTGAALAENHSLWINGMSTTNLNKEGQYNNFTYWGPSPTGTEAGINPKAVNWNGIGTVGATNKHIREALDKFCTGENFCHVAAHSAGNLQIGYALANYGGSNRVIHTRNSQGVYAPSGGVQTGWNIRSVKVAGGAAGGSEAAGLLNLSTQVSDAVLATLFSGEIPSAQTLLNMVILGDLAPATARSLYDHNVTAGVQFHMHAGAKYSPATRLVLLGEDDNLVAYHSSGGVAGSSVRALCNSRDAFCGELTLGSAPNRNSSWPYAVKGGEKWNNHTVAFRDDAGTLPHGSGQGPKVWGGIIGIVKAAMAAAN
jgi:hypothetical protein